MSSYTLIFDCPCCSVKYSTCDVKSFNIVNTRIPYYTWEFFCICRKCHEAFCVNASLRFPNSETKVSNTSIKNSHINKINWLVVDGEDISSAFKDFTNKHIILSGEFPPEHIPKELEVVFNEATQCYAIGCFNASGAMFRLCLDMVTKHIIEINAELNPTTNDKKTIHNRLTWIFKNNILSRSLENLSRSIKDDGNDAAHDGTIGKAEAEDLLDFTKILLERVYTEPERIRLAELRGIERRQK